MPLRSSHAESTTTIHRGFCTLVVILTLYKYYHGSSRVFIGHRVDGALACRTFPRFQYETVPLMNAPKRWLPPPGARHCAAAAAFAWAPRRIRVGPLRRIRTSSRAECLASVCARTRTATRMSSNGSILNSITYACEAPRYCTYRGKRACKV